MVKKVKRISEWKLAAIVSILGFLVFFATIFALMIVVASYIDANSKIIEVANDSSKPVTLMDCDIFKDMVSLQPSEKMSLDAVANRPTFSCRVFDASKDDYVYIGCLPTPTISAFSHTIFLVSSIKSDVPESSCGQ